MNSKMKTPKYKVSPKGKRKLDYPIKKPKSSVKLPLIGKTIYLDVKENKHLKQLQGNLKRLGATIEDFVSRDINYLITAQPRQRNKGPSCHGDESPAASPFNCEPSPSPSPLNVGDNKVKSVTRGKALAEKAKLTRKPNTLLDNAEQWGVKIVSLEGAFKWIDKELKKLPKVSANQIQHQPKCVSSYKILKSPFVKLEAESYCYRPFHIELDSWPRLNVDTPRGSCPFDGTLLKGEESREERGDILAAQVDIPSDLQKNNQDANSGKPATDKSCKKSDSEVVTGGRILTAGELKRRKEAKRNLERKRGYCECCRTKYDNLDLHVKEKQHILYVKNKTNYEKLDMLICTGPNSQHFLAEYLKKSALLNVRQENKSDIPVRKSPRKYPTQQYYVPKPSSKSPRNSTSQQQISQPIAKSPRKSSIQEVAQQNQQNPKSPRKSSVQEVPQLNPKSPRKSSYQSLLRSPRKSRTSLATAQSPVKSPKKSATPKLELSQQSASLVLNSQSPKRTRSQDNVLKESEHDPQSPKKVLKSPRKENEVGVKNSEENKTKEKSPLKQSKAGILENIDSNRNFTVANVVTDGPAIEKENVLSSPRNMRERKSLVNSPKSPKVGNDLLKKVFRKPTTESPVSDKKKSRKDSESEVSAKTPQDDSNKENIKPQDMNIQNTSDISVVTTPSRGSNSSVRNLRARLTDFSESQSDSQVNVTVDAQSDRGVNEVSEPCASSKVDSKSAKSKAGKKSGDMKDIEVDENVVEEVESVVVKNCLDDIVKLGRERTCKEATSDDFEVSYARFSRDAELPNPRCENVKNKTDKTFDSMIEKCDNFSEVAKSPCKRNTRSVRTDTCEAKTVEQTGTEASAEITDIANQNESAEAESSENRTEKQDTESVNVVQGDKETGNISDNIEGETCNQGNLVSMETDIVENSKTVTSSDKIIKKKKRPSKQFWHYEPVVEPKKSDQDERLKDLPAELRHLKHDIDFDINSVRGKRSKGLSPVNSDGRKIIEKAVDTCNKMAHDSPRKDFVTDKVNIDSDNERKHLKQQILSRRSNVENSAKKLRKLNKTLADRKRNKFDMKSSPQLAKKFSNFSKKRLEKIGKEVSKKVQDDNKTKKSQHEKLLENNEEETFEQDLGDNDKVNHDAFAFDDQSLTLEQIVNKVGKKVYRDKKTKKFIPKLPENKNEEKVETGPEKNDSVANSNDVFDFDQQRLSPEQMMTFTKTLAERIKERSMGRRSSVPSYNINELFSPGRIHSSPVTNNSKLKKISPEKKLVKKKSGSCIASAKVVNKYRNNRHVKSRNTGEENIPNGYQGDDEYEKTPGTYNISKKLNCKNLKPKLIQNVAEKAQIETESKEQSKDLPNDSKKKKSKQFWHYVPVVETDVSDREDKLKDLPPELRELKKDIDFNIASVSGRRHSRRSRPEDHDDDVSIASGSEVSLKVSSSTKQTQNDEVNVTIKNDDVEKSKQFTSSLRIKPKTPKQFWHYVPVVEPKDSDNDDKLKDLPLELRQLKNDIDFDITSVGGRRHSRRSQHDDEISGASESETNLNEKATQNKEENILPSTAKGGAVKVSAGKQKKQFWHYEPVVESKDDEENLKKLPVEIRRLKNDKLDMSGKRHSRRSHNVDDTIPNDCSGENLVQDTAESEQSQNKENVNVSNADHENAIKVPSKKNMKSKKFWDYVPVVENHDSGSDREALKNLPKELRCLKQDFLGVQTDSDDGKRRSRSKVNYSSMIISDDDDDRKNIGSHGDDDSDVVNSNASRKQTRGCKNKKKHVEIITDSESGSDDENENEKRIPRELKDLDTHLGVSGWVTDKTSNCSNVTDKDSPVSHLNDEINHQRSLRKRATRCPKEARTKRYQVRDRRSNVSYTEMNSDDCESDSFYESNDNVQLQTEEDNVSEKHSDSDYSDLENQIREMRDLNSRKINFNRRDSTQSSGRRRKNDQVSERRFSRNCKNAEQNKMELENEEHDNANQTDDMGQSDIDEKENSCEVKQNQSKANARRKRVFWDYEVVMDSDNTAPKPVDKSLPREVRSLQDALTDVRYERRSRKRPARSYTYTSASDSESTVQGSKTGVDESGDDEDEVIYVDKKNKDNQAMDDDDNDSKKEYDERSRSPVFNRHQNNRNKSSVSKRKGSPVFKRSPISDLYAKLKNRIGYTGDESYQTDPDSVSEQCPDSDDEVSDTIEEVNESVTKQEKYREIEKAGSGYSRTSREKRRKEWKRKLQDSMNKSSESQDRKRRKLEQHKSPRRRLLTDDDFQIGDKDEVSVTNCASAQQKELNSSLTWPSVKDGAKHGEMCGNNDKNIDKPGDDLGQFVPCIMSSPGHSNSSWGGAVDDYLDNSIKSGGNDLSFKGINFHKSPFKSPSKRVLSSPFKVCLSNSASKMKSPPRANLRTPDKRHGDSSPISSVKKVDDDIEFNFGSPQKNCTEFSHLKSVKGAVRNMSNSTAFSLTSTPHDRKLKQKHT